MRESRLETRFKNEVKKHGGIALKFTSPGTRGMPDRLVLLPIGRVVFAELKAPGKRLEPLQRKRFEDLKALGFSVYMVDSATAIDNFIAEVFK